MNGQLKQGQVMIFKGECPAMESGFDQGEIQAQFHIGDTCRILNHFSADEEDPTYQCEFANGDIAIIREENLE